MGALALELMYFSDAVQWPPLRSNIGEASCPNRTIQEMEKIPQTGQKPQDNKEWMQDY